jgi:hypothetical protein
MDELPPFLVTHLRPISRHPAADYSVRDDVEYLAIREFRDVAAGEIRNLNLRLPIELCPLPVGSVAYLAVHLIECPPILDILRIVLNRISETLRGSRGMPLLVTFMGEYSS